MLSAVITALLFVCDVTVIATFVIGAVREHQRHLQSYKEQKRTHPSLRHQPHSIHRSTGDGGIAVSGWIDRRFREATFPFPYFFTNLLVQA